jgi:hypothetical protein
MTPLEEAVRQALRVRAAEIRPPLPPLDLRRTHAWGRNPRVAYLRWTSAHLRWLGPVVAVIAVLAIIAGTLLSRGAEQRPVTPGAAQLEAGSGDIETSVPPYYVALVASHSVNGRTTGVATVRDTASGHVIARVRAPKPYQGFIKVSGATDDRTFVLLAIGAPGQNGVQPERFYLLRIAPATSWPADEAELTALPATDVSGGKQVDAMSLSPNGANLAAILNIGIWDYLYVYNLYTGKTRVWIRQLCSDCRQTELGDAEGPVDGASVSLSWTLNSQYLAFIAGAGVSQLRLLNLSLPGNNVQPNSTVIPVRGVPVAHWNWAVLTPDGETVFVGYRAMRGRSLLYSIARFSTVSGKLTGINKLTAFDEGRPTRYDYGYEHPAGIDEVEWTSYDGSEAVVMDAGPGSSAGIYNGSRYTPIPWPRNVVDAAW